VNYDAITLQERRNLWRAVIAEHRERSDETAQNARCAELREKEAHDKRRAQRRREWYADHEIHYAKEIRQRKPFLERTYIYDPASNASTIFISSVNPATLDSADICGVCSSPLNRFDPRWLPCGHILHFHCLKPRFDRDDEERNSCPHPSRKFEFNILRPITWVTCHMLGAKRRVHIFGYIRFEIQRVLAEELPYPWSVVLAEDESGVVEYRRYVEERVSLFVYMSDWRGQVVLDGIANGSIGAGLSAFF